MDILRRTAALFVLLFAVPVTAEDVSSERSPEWSFAIHGGAGTMDRATMTRAQQAEYKAALQAALDAGSAILRDGGSAADAVKAAIVLMEDDPKFNAGRGSVFTWDGANEMDAAIMLGETRAAGAVTGVQAVKNPILLADAVMADGRHVFLSGAGAEEFAADAGLETAPPEWFATDRRREALERVKARELSALDVDHKYGTVGAVALDMAGNLAAGTSTGGLTGKRWGRIGDAPMIGAGTYADNRSCAVSATGAGEYFIRVGVAHEICAALRFMGVGAYLEPGFEEDRRMRKNMAQAVSDSVMEQVKALGGDGGVILVTPVGDAIFSFNTQGMYRGRTDSTGMSEVAIFADE